MPKSWQVGDKTGTGENGAVNDLVVAYPPERRPIFVAVYMSESRLATAQLDRRACGDRRDWSPRRNGA